MVIYVTLMIPARSFRSTRKLDSVNSIPKSVLKEKQMLMSQHKKKKCNGRKLRNVLDSLSTIHVLGDMRKCSLLAIHLRNALMMSILLVISLQLLLDFKTSLRQKLKLFVNLVLQCSLCFFFLLL